MMMLLWITLCMIATFSIAHASAMFVTARALQPAGNHALPPFPETLLGPPGVMRWLHASATYALQRWPRTWMSCAARVPTFFARALPSPLHDRAIVIAYACVWCGALLILAIGSISIHAPMLAFLLVIIGVFYIPYRYRATQRAKAKQFIADIPLWIHVLMLASTAGVELGQALRASARLLADRPLGRVVLGEFRSLEQGDHLTGTLERLRTQHAHPLWQALLQLLMHALHTGAPALTVLQSLAEQSHAESVMRCERRGAMLSHAILLPTIICFLPAFFLVLAAALYLYLTHNPEWSQAWQMLAG